MAGKNVEHQLMKQAHVELGKFVAANPATAKNGATFVLAADNNLRIDTARMSLIRHRAPQRMACCAGCSSLKARC